ncbi:hypothetical protein PCK1_002406 [Pneumocystis canis]|nr:hypothetical protein PCK1_002406 [Pneumocystis canis]
MFKIICSQKFLYIVAFPSIVFLSNITFSSLSIEEISLISHVLTNLLMYFISCRTNLPHDLFFVLAISGPIIGTLPSTPLLKKCIRIIRTPPHRRTLSLKAKYIRCVIFSYLIIGISTFIVLQFGIKTYLIGDKNLVFWFIDYIIYENDSSTKQKMLLWWIICLIFSIFILKTFLYTPKLEKRIFYNNKKVSHIQLNKRRKFFHGIVVVMFLPTLYLDPLFSNISFSIALALFFICEVIRVFSLPPYGISLHYFLSQFTDERDNKGYIIVSHFYLLIGCASPLWLDFFGISSNEHQYQLKLKAISGILCLGFGDSAASLIGKKFGKIHWPNSKKTVEGTIAFILAVLFGAMLTEYMFWIKDFIIWRKFFIITVMTALFEAFSSQNDNILMPIYMWSLLNSKRYHSN